MRSGSVNRQLNADESKGYGAVVAGVIWASIVSELLNVSAFAAAKTHHLELVNPIGYVGLLILCGGSFLIGRLGTEAAVATILGPLLALLIETRFRGAGLRPGTFDFFEHPMLPWALPMVGFCWLGVLIAVVITRIRPHGTLLQGSRKWFLFSLAGLSLTSIVSMTATYRFEAGGVSEFPPTRHFALGVLALLSVFAWIAESRGIES